MSAPKVTIVDYGVGNLRSVARAFEHEGGKPEVTSDAARIREAERLALPGVGAFGHCMQELEKRALVEPVLDFSRRERPFLGICVGMQLMLTASEEFGEHAGLNLIPGRVRPVAARRLPVIGWMKLQKPPEKTWQKTLLEDTPEGSPAYFVHSFAAEPENSSARLAFYEYDGVLVTAAIASGHLTGLQFHPEKSATAGLRMIKRFLSQ